MYKVWYSLGAGLGAYFIYSYLYRRYKTRRLPPGPKTYPIVGNLPQIDLKSMHSSFFEWAKQYGDVFTVWTLGGRHMVIANDAELIRYVLGHNNTVFHDRASHKKIACYRSFTFSKGKGFIDGNYTEQLKQQKKCAMKALKFYGDGIANIEELSAASIREFLDYVEQQHGQPFLFNHVVYIAIVNIITSMVFGKQFEFGNPEVIKFKNAIENFIQHSTDMRYVMFDVVPYLKDVFPFVSNLKKVNESANYQRYFMKKHLQPIKESYDSDSVSCFAEKMYSYTKPAAQGKAPLLDDHDFTMVVFDILSAGFLTTHVALSATILIFMNHPEAEKKMVAEIHEVIGTAESGAFPSLEHKEHMPYTNAVVLEVLRYISHVTCGLPHYTFEEVDICDGRYTLPAGTDIVANLWFLHHDERLWDAPWEFKPERFLDDQGMLLPPGSDARKNLLAFGMGPRACLGETLAKNRMFLFIAALYQRYHWMPPEGEQPPSCDPRGFKDNFLIQPPEFYVRTLHRT